MGPVDVFAHLPDHIELDLTEAHRVLTALDIADRRAAGRERAEVRSVITLISRKLWPELGDLLDEES